MLALFLAFVAGSTTGAGARAETRPDPGCTTPAVRTDPEPVLRFGCATGANLRAMVADPADLERGRASTPPQGDAAVAAAKRHREDQVKPLIAGADSGSGAAQGGAGQTGGAQGAKGY